MDSSRLIRANEVKLTFLVLTLMNAAYLGGELLLGGWIYAADGNFIVHDFMQLWAAAKRAWSGPAILVYDWAAHVALQKQLTGVDTRDLGFFHAPHSLLLLMPLATFGYVPGFFAFCSVTAGMLAAALTRVARDKLTSIFMALSIGGGTSTFIFGQTGFLTAALFVAGLASVHRSPVLAGVFFGLLTVKPHFGLLLAPWLVLDQQWRTIGAAASTLILMAVSTGVLFGFSIWREFFSALGEISSFASEGKTWRQLQSTFALAYPFVGRTGALAIHCLAALLAIGTFFKVHSAKPNFETTAAALLSATLLITPYIYSYDTTLLVGAAAFLLASPTSRSEFAMIIASCVVPFLFLMVLGSWTPFGAWTLLYIALRRASLNVKSNPRKHLAKLIE